MPTPKQPLTRPRMVAPPPPGQAAERALGGADQLKTIAAKAEQVAAGKATFTAAEIQSILAAAVLSVTDGRTR